VPLPQRIAKAVGVFEGLGVHVDRIETKLGRPSSKWTEHDVTELQILFRSIDRREVTVDEAFPQPRVTADEVVASAAQPSGPSVPAGAWPAAATEPYDVWLEIVDAAAARGLSEQDAEALFATGAGGLASASASVAQLRDFLAAVKQGDVQ
jgi:hypothetical protein